MEMGQLSDSENYFRMGQTQKRERILEGLRGETRKACRKTASYGNART